MFTRGINNNLTQKEWWWREKMKKKYFFTTLQRVERGYNRIVQERSYYFSMVWKGLNNKSTHLKEKKSVKKREIYKYKIIFLFNKFKKVWSKGGQQYKKKRVWRALTHWTRNSLTPLSSSSCWCRARCGVLDNHHKYRTSFFSFLFHQQEVGWASGISSISRWAFIRD